MTTTTIRTVDPVDGSFVERTDSKPSSVELTTNAKGKVQISLKLYFDEGDEAGLALRLKKLTNEIEQQYAGRLAGSE